jgi:cytoskeletal protein CcmA (bactofilin family)
MKKLKIIVLALMVMAVPLFVFATTSHAGSFRSGDNVGTKKDEVVNHTLFIAGNNVEVNGTIKGDVFCAGQNVTVNAVVDGDVICAGMNLEINGTVMGDVRAAGQNVTLAAKVERNATLAGSNVRVDSGAKIGGDLQTGGEVTTINGSVARDLDAAGTNVTIAGMIGRDLQAATENLRLNSDAKVTGNVTYYSNNSISKAADAQVTGKISQKEPEHKYKERASDPFPGIIFSFFALLTFSFVFLALFPRKLRELSDLALTKPGMTVLIGLAATIGVPAVIILSFMTFVGAFVGITLLLAWIIVMLASGVLTSYYIGRLLFMRTPQHPFVVMLIGVAVLSILLLIPVVNILTIIATMLLGSGMVIRDIFAKSASPRYEKLTHPARKSAAKS